MTVYRGEARQFDIWLDGEKLGKAALPDIGTQRGEHVILGFLGEVWDPEDSHVNFDEPHIQLGLDKVRGVGYEGARRYSYLEPQTKLVYVLVTKSGYMWRGDGDLQWMELRENIPVTLVFGKTYVFREPGDWEQRRTMTVRVTDALLGTVVGGEDLEVEGERPRSRVEAPEYDEVLEEARGRNQKSQDRIALEANRIEVQRQRNAEKKREEWIKKEMAERERRGRVRMAQETENARGEPHGAYTECVMVLKEMFDKKARERGYTTEFDKLLGQEWKVKLTWSGDSVAMLTWFAKRINRIDYWATDASITNKNAARPFLQDITDEVNKLKIKIMSPDGKTDWTRAAYWIYREIGEISIFTVDIMPRMEAFLRQKAHLALMQATLTAGGGSIGGVRNP